MKKWEKPQMQDLNLSFTQKPDPDKFVWCPYCCKKTNTKNNSNNDAAYHEGDCDYFQSNDSSVLVNYKPTCS